MSSLLTNGKAAIAGAASNGPCAAGGQSAPVRGADDALSFLRGDGGMAAAIRDHDWSDTPLGPPSTWPGPLKAAVRTILATAMPAYIFWGQEGVFICNDGFRRAAASNHPLGATARRVAGDSWSIIGPQIEQVMNGGPATWQENQLVPVTGNGRRTEVYWTYSYAPIDDPAAPCGVGGVLCFCNATTAVILAERQIAQELERQRALFEQAPGFLAMLQGPDHQFEFANAAFIRLIGGRAVTGRMFAEAIPEAVEQGFLKLLDKAFLTGEPFVAKGVKYLMRARPEAPDIETYLDFIYQPIRDVDGRITGICVQGVDVTELTLAMHRLDAMARIDDLTRLPNRAAIIEGVEKAISRQRLDGEPFSLLYMDLDDFKRLNDRSGHAAGDEALREVASALRRSLRAEDLAGRLGGDEFAILVAGNRDQALAAAHRVREKVRARMASRGWRVTASIGVATFDRTPHSAESALAAADVAMYAAKRVAKAGPRGAAG